MQRMKAVAIIALTSCIFSADNFAMRLRPPTNFSLEFRVTNPAAPNKADVVVSIRIRMHGSRRLPTAEWDLASTAQYLGSWHEMVLDTLFKKLHMA